MSCILRKIQKLSFRTVYERIIFSDLLGIDISEFSETPIVYISKYFVCMGDWGELRHFNTIFSAKIAMFLPILKHQLDLARYIKPSVQ